jgi:hypothetical protein
MQIQGPDGTVRYLNIMYSDAALTEILFNAEHNISELPAHFMAELKKALDNFSFRQNPVEQEPQIKSMIINWRKHELQIASSRGTFVVYAGCLEGGNLSFDIYKTGLSF